MNEREEVFLRKWNVNGDDLQEQGIYDIAIDMMDRYERIVEIGCGTGQSTLSILLAGHKVFSIDFYKGCIDETASRISDIGYEIVENVMWSEEEATLMCVNLFDQRFLSEIEALDFDAIVIWNPGQGVRNRAEIIDQCVSIAKKKNVPIQVMDREDTYEHGRQILEETAVENGVRLIKQEYPLVRWNNVDGIKMRGLEKNELVEAIGLFYPE